MEDQNLIVAVCSRPVLYDTTMVSYRDRNKKERAWVDVAEDTGFPGYSGYTGRPCSDDGIHQHHPRTKDHLWSPTIYLRPAQQ
ncbi:unnamed protein product [Gadus morhua 'NCC']